MPSSGDRSLFWLVTSGIVVLDLGSKHLATSFLSPIPQPVIGRWLQWQLVYNPGAAFGLSVGPASRWVFAALGLAAVALVVAMARETPPGQSARVTALALVCGGALGNLLDRIRNPRGVVDFIDVGVAGVRWPTFNLADVAVLSGAAWFAVLLMRDRASVGADA